MSYNITLDEAQIKELNTALRILHSRRDNQLKYMANKRSNKLVNPKKRKANKLFLIINDKLELVEHTNRANSDSDELEPQQK